MKLRDAAELAEDFGYTPQTIRRLAADGRIPGIRLAPRSKWLFDEDAVRQSLGLKPCQPEPANQGA